MTLPDRPEGVDLRAQGTSGTRAQTEQGNVQKSKSRNAKVVGMFPHFFGFDVSAALPWTIGGFLLGVLLSALWRGLGIGRASSTQLQTALFDLNALRSSRDERDAITTKLQCDFGFLETALADAERRAATVPELGRANAELNKAGIQARAGWAAKATELENLKTGFQTLTSRNTTLEQRLQFISAESNAAGAASETRTREMEKLRADLAASEMRVREIEKLRADLAAAANALQDVPKLKSEYGAAVSEIEMLRAELEKRGATSAVSKHDYDTALQDLNATRNLSIKQANDIKALNAACVKLEADLAARAAAPVRALGFAGRAKGLKTRRGYAFRKANGSASSAKRVAAKIKAGGNGVSSGRGLPIAASGTFFLNKPAKWRGAVSQKGQGRVWAATGRGALANGLNGAESGSAHPSHGDGSDVAKLKARVVSLSDELENYRRLRDAVVAANRIAEGDV